jgi:integrase
MPRCRSDVVRRALAEEGEPTPAWIFPSPEGTALEERNVRTVFARLLATAEASDLIHDLRHTY